MNDSQYAEAFVKKMNTYAVNQLLLGRDVLFTFETQGKPLDISVVKQIVKTLI